jgi:hypothetical protein
MTMMRTRLDAMLLFSDTFSDTLTSLSVGNIQGGS